ncbi:MAG: YHS domain-containing protein [Candidatus Nitrosocaldus sp.]|nr:YHS domain-containing protein [Candidatus Nitrosocaldus sp.]MCS7141594.1 YHS domain-containing protein [Candidatus Nitrosocaldus sp.]MDW8000558.1 YHS domain-containing protein [Candidatus Nitrosocaldus sp.]MDW8274764.1 YHS domain-containing protein [Candidatus Nitrosocaldus sp.]
MRVLDPVCGIELDDDLAVTAEYEGKVYHFCCDGCKKIFLKNPKKYRRQVMPP